MNAITRALFEARRRRTKAGMATTETLVVVLVLGLGIVGASVAAGRRLHHEYRHDRALLASPFP